MDILSSAQGTVKKVTKRHQCVALSLTLMVDCLFKRYLDFRYDKGLSVFINF